MLRGLHNVARLVGPILVMYAGAGCAENDWEALFREPSSVAVRPGLEVALAALPDVEAALAGRVTCWREMGFGGVLVRVPPTDEATWGRLARLAEACRRAGLELGVRDFSASGDPAAARTQRLVWSAGGAGSAVPALQPGTGTFRELARQAVPEAGEVLPQQVVDLAPGQAAPTNGVWREFRWGLADVEPPQADCFDRDAVGRHINRLLVGCQNRLPDTYGVTLLWCQMDGPGRGELLWPKDLPELFLKRSGLGLMRYLPALAGVPMGGEATAGYTRRQVALSVRDAWRRYAETVDEQVHEAGLEAGIAVGDAPMDPEEVARYFRRPTLRPARAPVAREENVRAAGGARVMGRRFVIGELTCDAVSPTPAQALLPFPAKHEVDRLFGDGATRLKLAWQGNGLPPEDAGVRALCAYAARCQTLLQHGEAVADFLVWSSGVPADLEGYACDFANQTMLASAKLKRGRIRFDSERAYPALAVTADVLLGDSSAERLLRQAVDAGVAVWLIPSDASGEEDLFSRLAESGVGRVWGTAGEAAPLPDFVWRAGPGAEGLALRFLHRRTAGGELYFVANDSPSGGPVTCLFRDTGAGEAERWDPVSGDMGVGLQETRLADGRVSVPLFMGPHDACFVVFAR